VLITNHVLSGALIGTATRSPVAAFSLGVASHFALDAVPHWGDWGDDKSVFMRVAVRDGLTGLAVMGVLTALAEPSARLAVLAGMAGAALPDLDKPSKVFFGFSPFPQALDDFHAGIQRESIRRFPVEVATGAACLATLAILALWARRSPR
jgi:hypothetical protein